MTGLNRVLAVVFLALMFGDAHWARVRSRPQDHETSPAKYIPVDKYNPKRDAARDIRDAIAEAKRTGRRVLLEVGGDWCGWCHSMDRFFEQNSGLLALRERNYVTVKINFSTENENKAVLSRYPTIPGYPHIFVLDAEGKLLHSQDTSKLESGSSYDLKTFMEFLRKWSPTAANK